MKTMLQRLAATEPVRLAAALRTVLVAGVAFGLNVSPEQIAGLVLATETVGALFVRSRVSPLDAEL